VVGSGAAYSSGYPLTIDGSPPSIFQARAIQTFYNRTKTYQVAEAKETERTTRIDIDIKRDDIIFRTASLYLDAGAFPLQSERRSYVDYVTAQIRAPRKLRVAIDAGNGPGGVPSVPIFRRLGHEVIELYTEPDGRFPNHHPDPTVLDNLQPLIAAVREHRCDLGIAYDGDAS